LDTLKPVLHGIYIAQLLHQHFSTLGLKRMPLLPNDWAGILLPHQPLVESVVRISLVYLTIYTLLRVVLKREAGGESIADILVIVLIADILQNGMVGGYSSVGDGLILASTLIFWDWFLSWLSYHSKFFRALIKPKPLPVIRDGRILTRNARRELLTRGDLIQEIQLQGIESIEKVKEATLQPNGKLSVVPYEEPEHPSHRDSGPPGG
jgi:uncharacterized membrane protein YcaP (DUF421 family)